MVMEEDIIEEILRLEEERDRKAQLGNVSERMCVSQPILNLPGIPYTTVPNASLTSWSCPLELMQGRSEAQVTVPPTEAYANYKRRKESHNMFERRRRSVIRDRIRELATLLPRKNEPHFECVLGRCNTGQILRSSVNYLQRLKMGLERHREVEARQQVLENENHQLWVRIKKLERMSSKYGIKLDDSDDFGEDQGC